MQLNDNKSVFLVCNVQLDYIDNLLEYYNIVANYFLRWTMVRAFNLYKKQANIIYFLFKSLFLSISSYRCTPELNPINVKFELLKASTLVDLYSITWFNQHTFYLTIQGPDLVIHQPDRALETMDDWCTRHHGQVMDRVLSF